MNSQDVFGKALTAYTKGATDAQIIVRAQDFEDDYIPVSYLYRDYSTMPVLERTALNRCQGAVLDIGCCAGSHSLYLQDVRKLPVTAIDISPGATAVCQTRGVCDVSTIDFYDLPASSYDTLLLLMNGTGFLRSLKKASSFFDKARTLLVPGGTILMDGSDIRHVFTNDNGELWKDLDKNYFGEMKYQICYGQTCSATFDWLYLDYPKLSQLAHENRFKAKCIQEDGNAYLAELMAF